MFTFLQKLHKCRRSRFLGIEKRGFTLIEMLLALTITSVLLALLVLFMRNSEEVYQKNQSIREVNEQGVVLIENLAYAIRHAQEIIAPAPGESDSTLELSFVDVSQNPIVVSFDGDTVSIDRGGVGSEALHSDRVVVSSFEVQNVTQENGWGTVSIMFTMAYNNQGNRFYYDYEKSWQTSITVRNYEQP